MYTSDTKSIRRSLLNTAMIYLAASIICAVFGGVYEIFSHGVFSGFMVFAFCFPLLGGFLPFLLLTYMGGKLPGIIPFPGILSRNIYHCGLLALTIGSIMTGIIEIYGTTNRLLLIYWIAGILLVVTGLVLYMITAIMKRRGRFMRML